MCCLIPGPIVRPIHVETVGSNLLPCLLPHGKCGDQEMVLAVFEGHSFMLLCSCSNLVEVVYPSRRRQSSKVLGKRSISSTRCPDFPRGTSQTLLATRALAKSWSVVSKCHFMAALLDTMPHLYARFSAPVFLACFHRCHWHLGAIDERLGIRFRILSG